MFGQTQHLLSDSGILDLEGEIRFGFGQVQQSKPHLADWPLVFGPGIMASGRLAPEMANPTAAWWTLWRTSIWAAFADAGPDTGWDLTVTGNQKI